MSTYLVFGDLHGRVLPAFALARAWQREHETPLAGLLQVGDLGYFPFSDRLDRATKAHAKRDPLELGAQLVVRPSREADELFADPDTPGPLWFIAGNHEDHEALTDCYGLPGSTDDDFPVDSYGRLRCISDGHVLNMPDGLRVGGLWGIDDEAPGRAGPSPRREAPDAAGARPGRPVHRRPAHARVVARCVLPRFGQCGDHHDPAQRPAGVSLFRPLPRRGADGRMRVRPDTGAAHGRAGVQQKRKRRRGAVGRSAVLAGRGRPVRVRERALVAQHNQAQLDDAVRRASGTDPARPFCFHDLAPK